MRPKKGDAAAAAAEGSGKTPPGRWVCTITGSAGGEGSASEHVQTLYSDDSGLSWSAPVSVEPSPLNTEVRKRSFLRYHFIY